MPCEESDTTTTNQAKAGVSQPSPIPTPSSNTPTHPLHLSHLRPKIQATKQKCRFWDGNGYRKKDNVYHVLVSVRDTKFSVEPEDKHQHPL